MTNVRPFKFAVSAMVIALAACAPTHGTVPFFNYGQNGGAGSTGVATIHRGDTVGKIAERYKLDVRDILVINHLQAPYNLTPGQRLKLPAPRTYRTREGDTLYSVAHMFGTNQAQLVRLNDLHAPYALHPGLNLKLPVVEDANKVDMAALSMPTVPALPPPSVSSSPLYAPPGLSGADNGARQESSGRIDRAPLPPPQASSSQILSAPLPPPQPGQGAAPPNQPAATLQVTGVGIAAPEPQMAKPALVNKLPDIIPPRSSSSQFLRPVDGPILSAYGNKPDGLHNDGVNIKAPLGAPVRAAENGVVVYASNELKGFGNLVLIRHADRWMTAYAHLGKLAVAKGQTVHRGDIIGTVGQTGNVSAPQLHFEVRHGMDALNPEKFM